MAPRGPPTKSEQLDYLMQWFLEYSEVQRDDFLLILINKFAPTEEETLPDIIKILNVTDRAPSIFQCRMNLFNDWFVNWSDEEKTTLLKRLTDTDDDFIQKFHEAIDNNQPDLLPDEIDKVDEEFNEIEDFNQVEEEAEGEETNDQFNEVDELNEDDEEFKGLQESEKMTNHLSDLQNDVPNEFSNEL